MIKEQDSYHYYLRFHNIAKEDLGNVHIYLEERTDLPGREIKELFELVGPWLIQRSIYPHARLTVHLSQSYDAEPMLRILRSKTCVRQLEALGIRVVLPK